MEYKLRRITRQYIELSHEKSIALDRLHVCDARNDTWSMGLHLNALHDAERKIRDLSKDFHTLVDGYPRDAIRPIVDDEEEHYKRCKRW